MIASNAGQTHVSVLRNNKMIFLKNIQSATDKLHISEFYDRVTVQ